jgi:hypothetical protein
VAEQRPDDWLTANTHEVAQQAAPGSQIVYVHTWRPEPADIIPPDGVSAYGGVARKP